MGPVRESSAGKVCAVIAVVVLIVGILIAFNYRQIASQNSLTITAPASISSWTKGNTYTITWSTSGSISNVKIELYSSTSLTQTLSSSTVNDGSYSWSISTGLSDGSSYRIKIIDTTDSGVYDYSDYFQLTTANPKMITVTSPTSSSSWTKGNTYTITWSTSGSIFNVKIELYSSASLVETLTTSTPNDGTHSWSIDSGLTAGTNFRIKITDAADSGVFDYSDYFEIKNTFSGTIIVTAPTSSTTWVKGTYGSITWTCTGGVPNVRIELYKAGVLWQTVGDPAVNDGEFGWTVPTGLADGSQYQIMIFCIEYPFVFDYTQCQTKLLKSLIS